MNRKLLATYAIAPVNQFRGPVAIPLPTYGSALLVYRGDAGISIAHGHHRTEIPAPPDDLLNFEIYAEDGVLHYSIGPHYNNINIGDRSPNPGDLVELHHGYGIGVVTRFEPRGKTFSSDRWWILTTNTDSAMPFGAWMIKRVIS